MQKKLNGLDPQEYEHPLDIEVKAMSSENIL